MIAASNGFFHAIGAIFHPIFVGFAWLMAAFYAVIPNYAVAISLLTLVIMAALTPLTVKSTKSMLQMQKIQPELKKLQQKYKGPENRQALNEEMMRLYREQGVNPLGSCFPVLLQAPFLFILYNLIRGLSNVVHHKSVPRYVPHGTRLYHDIVASHGAIKAFGVDLALKPFSHHSSWIASIPFFALVAIAVGLQYFQMWQMNTRNKVTGQAIPSQQLMLQRIMPIFFTYFYIVIPAAVVVYMVISTIVRIITQDVMFRTGVSNPNSARHAPKEKELPATSAVEESEPAPKSTGAKNAPAPKAPPAHPRAKNKRKRKDR